MFMVVFINNKSALNPLSGGSCLEFKTYVGILQFADNKLQPIKRISKQTTADLFRPTLFSRDYLPLLSTIINL